MLAALHLLGGDALQRELVDACGRSKGSVSARIEKLVGEGFVNHDPAGFGCSLTEAGPVGRRCVATRAGRCVRSLMRTDRTDAHAKYIKAREELGAIEKRYKEEQHAAFMKRHLAQMYQSDCSNADYELIRLRTQRPLLFTEGPEPRLRSGAD